MFKQTAEQVAVIDAVKTGGNVNIQAFAGSGKAQPVWSIVKTPFGDKAIGDLKVGDSIFRKDGNIGKVVGVYPQGVQPYSKVTFRDGSHTYCNKDHLWTVYNLSSKKKGSTKTVPLSYFIDKGLTAHGNMRFKIQMCSPCQYPEKQYYIHPYVLGVLIGDGSMVGSTPCCSFGEKDKEIINHFSNLLPEGYAMTLRYTSDNCQQATLFHSELKGKSNPLHDEIGRLGLKVKSGYKFIPTEYKHGSVSQRLHLLRGLMDSDGSCRLNRTTFCSTSRQLIEDVKELVASLGGTCIETGEYVKDTSVTFNLNVKMTMNPFLVDSKASKWSYSYKNPPSRYIMAIEDAGECEQVCIKVDAEDSLYLTDSYIVTHNTTTMSAVSEAIPTKSCLYMAFNKAIADDAVGKMYNNTTCRTMHSVAYTGVSRELTAKLRHPRILPKDLAKNYNLAAIGIDGRSLSAGMQMSAINNAINTWCNSAEDQVTSKDVVLPEWIEKHDAAYIAEQLAKTAREHWTQLLSPNNKLPISHDVYLKRWALGQPKLPFDVLFLDECQDVSGVILEVVKQQNAQIIAVGDIYQSIYCQPKGTKVKRSVVGRGLRGVKYYAEDVNIEDLKVGDKLWSYHLPKAHLFRSGKPITRIGSKLFTGNMVTVTCGGNTTSFTEDHTCLVRFGRENDHKYCTYLMRKGDKWRVGISPFASQSQNMALGFSLRAAREQADALWIIAMYDTKREARLAEEVISFDYRVPQTCFTYDANETGGGVSSNEVWDAIDLSKIEVERLFKDFKMLQDRPLWKANDQSSKSVKRRCVFEIAACNLRDGMTMSVFDPDACGHGKLPISSFKPISISSEYVEDLEVWSMDVETSKTYFANNILTHNCWRGSLNAMELLDGTTCRLSQSFRFGQAIASYADNLLSMLGNNTPLRGFESVSSSIGTVVAPDAILCRTNAGCVSELIANIGNNDGRRYSLNVNMSEIKAFINAVKQVKRYGKTEHFVLSAFTSFSELLEYCKDNPKDTEITGTIALIQKFGEDKLLTIIEQASNVHRADCVITTAHKAKGLEWDKVKINNDFNLNIDKRGKLNVSEAELRLIYVAVTRAKLELDTTGLMLLNRQFRTPNAPDLLREIRKLQHRYDQDD